MARWEPNQTSIQATVSGHGRALVSQVVRGTTNLAKIRAPRKTGRMANSIGGSIRETPNAVRGLVGTRVKYALIIHRGARAHKIRPRRQGGMLKFYWERAGMVVWLRSVNHPGVGATPFLTSALQNVAPALGFKVVLEVNPDSAEDYL